MMKLVSKFALKIGTHLTQLRNEERGVAAVEFALILPVMLFAYLGISEVSRLIIMDRRLAVVAGSVGDLVARADGTILDTTLEDYFEAAEFTMAPYPAATLRQVVSSVYVDDNGIAEVQWSEGHNGGITHADGAIIPLPTQMANQSKEKYLIVGEATTVWTPIIDFVFQSGFTLEKTYYYRPRFDSQILLIN